MARTSSPLWRAASPVPSTWWVQQTRAPWLKDSLEHQLVLNPRGIVWPAL